MAKVAFFKTRAGKELVFNTVENPSSSTCRFSLDIEGTSKNIGMWIESDAFIRQAQKITELMELLVKAEDDSEKHGTKESLLEALQKELRKLITMLIKNGGYSSLQIAHAVAEEIFDKSASKTILEQHLQCLAETHTWWEKHGIHAGRACGEKDEPLVNEVKQFIVELMASLMELLGVKKEAIDSEIEDRLSEARKKAEKAEEGSKVVNYDDEKEKERRKSISTTVSTTASTSEDEAELEKTKDLLILIPASS